ncbi:hypothetical protein [uncultured Alistipes sp.]|uniref:hypothetical protein n=1 Tax=uncultured Alistipes sp. TaxID=538949 RepID=UPI0026584665|nr:hypothetical protein [uncultured Alistipes sp.]
MKKETLDRLHFSVVLSRVTGYFFLHLALLCLLVSIRDWGLEPFLTIVLWYVAPAVGCALTATLLFTLSAIAEAHEGE